jgi:Fe-S oxidoreductase/nitrate reductase gamma subunit
MPVERTYFWEIHPVAVFYVLAALSVVVFLFGAYLRVSVWLMARGGRRLGFSPRGAGLVAVDGLLGRRIFRRDPIAGLMHALIMWGFVGLFVGTVMSTVDHWFVRYLTGETYRVYSLCLEILGIMLVVGVLIAVVRRYVVRVKRLENKRSDLWLLVLLAFVAITGFIVEGLRLAGGSSDPETFSFGGAVLARLFSTPAWAAAAYPYLWWLHALAALGLIAYFPFSKLFHSLVAPVNIYLAPGADAALPAIAGEGDDPETTGPRFPFEELVGLSACMRCGRCDAVCPSASADEPFSPRSFIANANAYTRRLLESEAPATRLVTRLRGRSVDAPNISPDQSWFCTTCRACLEVCPIYVAAFRPVRRARMAEIEEGSGVSPLLTKALETLYTFGNPWEPSKRKRTGWAEGLDIPDITAGDDADLCYWVGCTTSIDTRTQKLACAFARILAHAGVSFGTLGQKEGCCGDIARRVGEEGLFEEQAEETAALLEKHAVRDVVTSSPHCYNMFTNEYPKGRAVAEPGDSGATSASVRFRHYTQVLEELLDQGRLAPLAPVDAVVTYHDPCYLGRYNHVYEAPRRVIRAIPGVRLVEMKHHGADSLCCGGGGGRMWQELEGEKKLSEVRAREAAATGARILVTTCPYCLIMMEDAVKTAGLESRLAVLDLNELVGLSLGLGDEGG